MLKILIWNDTKEFIDSLKDKHKLQIAKRIKKLAENPKPIKSKLLEGFDPLRRLRAGVYRIVYFVKDNVINVVLIDRRNDNKVYKKLIRKFK